MDRFRNNFLKVITSMVHIVGNFQAVTVMTISVPENTGGGGEGVSVIGIGVTWDGGKGENAPPIFFQHRNNFFGY
jgi:hypothetical protein